MRKADGRLSGESWSPLCTLAGEGTPRAVVILLSNHLILLVYFHQPEIPHSPRRPCASRISVPVRILRRALGPDLQTGAARITGDVVTKPHLLMTRLFTRQSDCKPNE